MSANVYDTLPEKQRKEIQEAIDSFKEGAFDIHNYIRSFEPTNELPIGIYNIPKDCRAVVLEGGRSIEIRKKKNLPLEPPQYRCKDCRHFVEGHATFSPRWTTIVCDAKPKKYSEAMQRIMEKNGYKDFQIFFAANTYGKPCEIFELKEEEK